MSKRIITLNDSYSKNMREKISVSSGNLKGEVSIFEKKNGKLGRLLDKKNMIVFGGRSWLLTKAFGTSLDGNDSDVYSKEIIDLINQWLTEHKNDFICIIAGYKDDLKSSFFSFNDGLERRFPIRFGISGYSSSELKEILMKTVDHKEWLKGKVISEGVVNPQRAYEAAITERYRFYSYGDALLII
jgi:hypothetical protein